MRKLIILALALAACTTSAPPPVQTQTAPPQPQVSQSPNRLTPIAAMPKEIAKPSIRVGLLTEQTSISFPRVDGGYYLVSDNGASTLRRGFTVTAPLADKNIRYGVQVAAIVDRPSAQALLEKIQSETGQRVDMLFDPSASNGGMYRIIAGDFPDATSAQPLRADLTQRGYGSDMLIVRRPTDTPFEKTLDIVDDEGERYKAGGSLLIVPVSADSIQIGDKPYRTAARLFINARGLINVINELGLEEYLYGVVPAEMGPKVFDELEALKAQAIAARTYAVRNLGQFATEGYDICPGPACQAYLGFSGEDPLSTQAVNETAGQVMTYGGKLIDALYTATCGGETSDVSTMFPNRSDPYLKRVRCVELDMTSIDGRADSGILTEQQVNARMFASMAGLPMTGSSWAAGDVVAAVHGAQTLLSGAAPSQAGVPALPSSRRGDVLRYLAATFSLDRFGRTLTLPEDRKYFFAQSANPEAAEYAAAAFLIKYGILPAQDIDRIDLGAAMPREELYALLGSWLRKHEMLEEVSGKIQTIDGRTLTLKDKGTVTKYTLPANIPIFRRLGDRYQEYKTVPVMLGDRAFLQQSNGRVVAAIIQANYDGASFDRTSSFANWTRSYRAEELVASINKRQPISQLVDLRPVAIDASQRIAELQVIAENGRVIDLKGLPVRWSLNVPDNLFVIEKTKDPDGVDRYTFFGKGWGHGIGLCQVGAYGMAFRGWTYDRILKTYYTGIEIVPMAQAAR
jgi:stage II sporulation protein D